MPNNPSELQRLIEELDDIKRLMATSYMGKSDKERCLRQMRNLERQLGLESKPYNA